MKQLQWREAQNFMMNAYKNFLLELGQKSLKFSARCLSQPLLTNKYFVFMEALVLIYDHFNK